MDEDDWDCQSCLAKLVGAQAEEGVVHSREEGTDFAEAGTASDSEQAGKAGKAVVMQVTDTGTPLGCRDRKKKAAYP